MSNKKMDLLRREQFGFVFIIPNDVKIENNMLLLTEREATFFKLSQGDMISSENEEITCNYGKKDNYSVAYIYEKDVFQAYFITDQCYESGTLLLLCKKDANPDEFYEIMEHIRLEYKGVKLTTNEERYHEVKETFAVNNIIYYSVIVIVAIVLSITANAVLVGIYDKRKNEFTLYSGIGIERKCIYRKIFNEILLMDILGILLCTAISILAITCLNTFLFGPSGLKLRYFNKTALAASICCNFAVLIPGTLLRIHSVAKHLNKDEFLT